jgi:transcriptional regulator with XRE-family HTH domain
MHIKKFRTAAKLTKTELAQASGVDLSIISRLESRKRLRASYETTVRLARALGVEPEQLAPVRLRRQRPPILPPDASTEPNESAA